jgi:hypothetical protein
MTRHNHLMWNINKPINFTYISTGHNIIYILPLIQ